MLQKAKEQNDKSKRVLDDELSSLNVDKQYEELITKHDKMQDQRTQLIDEMEILQKLMVNALSNVDNVMLNATKIVNSFKDTKSYSLDSVKAANSYSKIKGSNDESERLIYEADKLVKNTNNLIIIGNKTERSN